jgi:branched-chain amino acid transport system substrate-binding protein
VRQARDEPRCLDRARGTALATTLCLFACAIGVPAALAAPAATPGVTPTTVLLGGTVPLSGPATLFGSVALGADAYFKYVNGRGGVNGRKILYKILDDQYNPALTVQETRQLVQQDEVLAIFNSLGTDNSLAVRDFLNQSKVPQLFVGTGVSSFAREHAEKPWSIGFLPSFFAEAEIYGRYVLAHRPKARIAVLYENNQFGKDMVAGLRKSLGAKAGALIKAVQGYELTDTTVESQVAALKASGADTLMTFATPQFAILTYIAAYKLGWKPQVFLSSVSPSPNIMEIARLSSGTTTNGTITIAFVKDPTNPRWAKDRAIGLYRTILKRYLPGKKPEDVYLYYGMAVAYTMVDALERAGRNLTRDTLLRAATHLDETNPFMYPGIKVQTSPKDYFPIEKAYLLRFQSGKWQQIGGLVDARE